MIKFAFMCNTCKSKKRIRDYSRNNLGDNFPLLLKEWDYDRNDVDPFNIPKTYNKRVHWVCSTCSYKWETTPASRTSSLTGCPKCNTGGHEGNKDNYIDIKYPHLLKHWDYEKNEANGIGVRTISCYSRRKAHWKCVDCNHQYERALVLVTKHNAQCPECKKKKRYEKIITCYDCGYTWNRMETHPCKSENTARKNCPNCLEQNKIDNLFKNRYPELVKYLHSSVDTNLLTFKPSKMIKCNCPECNHTWNVAQKKLIFSKEKCPRCRNEKIAKEAQERKELKKQEKFNRELTENLKKGLVIEIDGVYYTRKQFKEKFGVSKSAFRRRWDKGKRGKELLEEFSDYKEIVPLSKYKPSVLVEWDYTKNNALGYYPDKLSYKSDVYVNWVCCSCSFEWEGTIRGRTGSSGGNCPKCSSIASKFPEIIKDWDYNKNTQDPYLIPPYSGKKFHWCCHKCKYEWEFSAAARSYGSECPNCSISNGKGVSKIERRIFYFIKKIYDGNVVNGQKFKKKEIDILINDKFGIEYDGVFWHSNKKELDENKANFVRSHGLTLIRIREVGLDIVDDYDIEYDFKDSNALNHVLRQVVKLIPMNSDEQKRFDRIIKNNLSDVKIPKEYMIYPLRENSIINTHPELLNEWDYDKNKNNDIIPEYVTFGQNVKIHWKCGGCGEDWLTTPYIKFRNIDTCKYCRGVALKIDKTDLINHWDYNKNKNKPSNVSSKSTEQCWWICEQCGTSFKRTPALMLDKKYGCTNNGCDWSAHNAFGIMKSRINFNNTIGVRSTLLRTEWMESKNKVSAYEIPYSTNKKAWWKCSNCSYEWESRIDSRCRSVNPAGCPKCSRNKSNKTNDMNKDINELELRALEIEANYKDCVIRYLLNGYSYYDMSTILELSGIKRTTLVRVLHKNGGQESLNQVTYKNLILYRTYELPVILDYYNKMKI